MTFTYLDLNILFNSVCSQIMISVNIWACALEQDPVVVTVFVNSLILKHSIYFSTYWLVLISSGTNPESLHQDLFLIDHIKVHKHQIVINKCGDCEVKNKKESHKEGLKHHKCVEYLGKIQDNRVN